jgi:adenylate cyclase
MKRSLLAELQRRNVLRAALLYAGAVWALAQGIAQLGPSVGAPDWVTRWFLVAAAIGFPFWLAFAWYYEFTPQGLKRESEVESSESITHHSGRKLDFAIIAVLAVAVVLLVTDRFVLHQGLNETGSIPDHSIAVLPFVNMSDDKANEYFSDGISEELLNLLARIPQLQVTARTSSFAFKDKGTGIAEIARALHVANVLEGSVRKSGNLVRITAQLIRAGTNTHLWSRTYDRKLEDIFAIQDEIAADVVKQLEVTLLGAAPKVRMTDPQAYALFLQAKQVARPFTAEALQQSDAMMRQVLAIDPRYAPAWIALSANITNEINLAVLPAKEGYAQAREAARNALEIDPEYARAHAQLGWIAMTGGNDLPGAAQHFERALALDPNDLAIVSASAWLLGKLARLDEALALEEAVVRRDPVNVRTIGNLGSHQRMAGRFDAAIASFRTLLILNPGYGGAHAFMGLALLLKGDAQGALTEIEQEKNGPWKMIGLPMAYHALGRKSDSDAALDALIAKYEKDWSYDIAYVYAYRGEADKAFEWLAREEEGPGSKIVTDNLFDNLHTDPRWLPLLRKFGWAPEELAKIKFKVEVPQMEGADASGGAKP